MGNGGDAGGAGGSGSGGYEGANGPGGIGGVGTGPGSSGGVGGVNGPDGGNGVGGGPGDVSDYISGNNSQIINVQKIPIFRINPEQVQTDLGMYNVWGMPQTPQMNPFMQFYGNSQQAPFSWGNYLRNFK